MKALILAALLFLPAQINPKLKANSPAPSLSFKTLLQAPEGTLATAMHFARLIPDWNSLDSVRHAHSVLEGAALVLFALLVLFDIAAHFSDDKKRQRLLEKIGLFFFAVAVLAEVAAYPYGQRNDELSSRTIDSLQREAEATSAKLDGVGKEADDLTAKYVAAEREAVELRAKLAPRRLSSADKALLRKKVAAFATKNISLSCGTGSATEGREALDFELDFLAAFSAKPPILKVDSYNSSCSLMFVPGAVIPPMQIEYGAQRRADALILTKALEASGIGKKDILTKTTPNKLLLNLGIGPKAP